MRKEDEDKFQEYHKALATNEGVYTSHGSGNRTFQNWTSDFSIKSDYTKRDYDYFRGNNDESRHSILRVCQKAYEKVAIVKNVIDLMGDFGGKGIRLQHPVPAVQRFHEAWFEKVKGVEKTERFLNLLYRLGTVPIYRTYARLPRKEEKEFKKVKAASRRIPIKYHILNPSSIDVKTDSVGHFLGDIQYVLKFPSSLQSRLKSFVAGENFELNILPPDLVNSVKTESGYYEIPNDRFSMYFYKKDDWEVFPKPMTYSIIDDIVMLEKMKLADMSALDGAISNIRLWKIGHIGDNPQNTLLPTRDQMQKLRNILASNVGGGTIDLVWGPELDFKESNTNVHHFLGEGKYKISLDSIYDGLGIPQAFRSGSSSSTTDHYSLKTLIERLIYGRSVLLSFWNEELKVLQKEMGFSKPAVVTFDNMVLTDEAAEKQLLIHLVDRNIVSEETIRERFHVPDNIEDARIRREEGRRGKRKPVKAGPFHNPEFEKDIKKILVQTGVASPSQVGVELDEKTDDTPIETRVKQEPQDKPSPPGQGGRPRAVKETKKRDQKKGTVPTKAFTIENWAKAALKKIHDLSAPAMLHAYGKKNLRSLSWEQADEFESIKAGMLFKLDPLEDVDEEKVLELLTTPNLLDSQLNSIDKTYRTLSEKYTLTVEDRRNFYANVYSQIVEVAE